MLDMLYISCIMRLSETSETEPKHMISYRKIGGIHWLAIGQLRLSFCRTRRPVKLPPALWPVDLAFWANDMSRLYADRVI